MLLSIMIFNLEEHKGKINVIVFIFSIFWIELAIPMGTLIHVPRSIVLIFLVALQFLTSYYNTVSINVGRITGTYSSFGRKMLILVGQGDKRTGQVHSF